MGTTRNMNMNMSMDGIMFPTAEHIDVRQQALIQHNDDVWMYNQTCSDYPAQQPSFWPAHLSEYQQSHQFPRLSTSTHSSYSSHLRDSDSSTLSNWQSCSSVASTNSNWSNLSNQPYGQRTSSLNNAANFAPPISSSHTAESVVEPVSPAPSSTSKRRNIQRYTTPGKDTFATCVSRRRRSRRSQREPRYWCTSCEEPFIEKYDWKRHEETYQERRHVFRCDLCSAVYFLEKDFLYHHETRHNCETCQREGHSDTAKQTRQARSGWGCGFCLHFSFDWRERCNHVAQHFEKEQKSMKNWLQSNVIHSLLQRPVIFKEWLRILHTQPQLRGDFGWNRHDTERVEGYPENNAEPNLQDRLEYFKPSENAAALAQFAFKKIAFPSHPPQAPRKDHKDHHTATLQDLMDDTESWNSFVSTILEDEISPTNICDLDFNVVDKDFSQDTGYCY
ncbi:uncharacterized protein EKO05_0007266 [Ascochyta rabiei]|uniref:uncharacterized protein n=1 Tax=Didymella rabiei TaxID=5454 RepID=UPI0022033A2A|nr:uncharacterized protein EKO05_0007266 [Ascochyta rabiei]UPX16883.1 hypothetical protein EKO05_0007266 [Ascochyta rabiei]